MRIAIYGAGALGTVLGVYLEKAGLDVVLVNRNKEHVRALNEYGAKVIGEIELSQKVKAITPDMMEGYYDVIFLMTKQVENETVAKFLRDKIREDSIVCTTQNGLPEIKLMEILGEERVVGATAVWGASLVSPGVAKLTSNPNSMSFQIGSLSSNCEERLKTIKSILENMCPVYIEENFMGARWSKLLINAAFSGLSTIFNCDFGEIAKVKELRNIAQRVIKETIDVIKAADIKIMPIQGRDITRLMDYKGPIKKKIANLIIPIAMRNHKHIRSGMLYDLERGRKTEVDAINGVVVDFGRKYKQATPFNDRIVETIYRIEQGKLKSSLGNIDIFYDLMKGKTV